MPRLLRCLLICICASMLGVSYASVGETSVKSESDDSSSVKKINTNVQKSSSVIDVNLKFSPISTSSIQSVGFSLDDYFLNIINATDKFVQRNTNASWDDFKSIIINTPDNDFYHMILANKMAELGFYDLANLSFSKIRDKEFIQISQNSIKRFYYPKGAISLDNELFLAQIYSDIMFNNQAVEATKELLKNSKVSGIDYANYLLALGFYNSNNFKEATAYINKAISLNPSNLNYIFLKAKICADNKRADEALRTINSLKKAGLKAYKYQQKTDALESYILYKVKRSRHDKYYYLGKYYYYENDYSRALTNLQLAVSGKNFASKAKVYGLMSEIYFSMQDYSKALESAKKARGLNSSQFEALVTLGDLEYRNKNYKSAMSYFKKASSHDNRDCTASIKIAKTYNSLENTKKAKEIYGRILKGNPYNWLAFYELALLDEQNQEKFLKKSISIYPLNANSWAELAKVKINQKDYNSAKKYLESAFYIDENNFKYYYYQGVLCKTQGDLSRAKASFKKCLKLDNNNPSALRELNNIKQMEEKQYSL